MQLCEICLFEVSLRNIHLVGPHRSIEYMSEVEPRHTNDVSLGVLCNNYVISVQVGVAEVEMGT